jgi:hypothetical protein
MREKQKVVITKPNFKKKLLYLTNYALRERGYKENLLQPHNLDLTRKNIKAITRMLKTPLNEL